MLFRKKLSQRDFFAIFNLAKQYPYLKQLKEYKELMKWGDHVYIKINHLFQNHDFLEAIKLAPEIKDFPAFKEEIGLLLEQSEVYLKFDQAIRVMDKNEIYKLLDRYPFLADVPVVESLDETWDEAERQSEALIAKGDVSSLLILFADYFHISYKKRHLIMILKSAYIRQVERAIKKGVEQGRIIAAIETLYTMFGEDDLLELLANKYSQLTGAVIEFNNLIPGNLTLLNASQFPVDIINQ